MRSKFLVSLILVFCLIIGGINAQAEERSTLYMPWEPDDIFYNPWAGRGHVNLFLYNSLLTCNSDMLPEYPSLARDWEISEDRLTYTFYLRDNLNFHDGKSLTTEDVRWSIETALLSPMTRGTFKDPLKRIKGADKYIEGEVENLSGIKVFDGQTIEINLDKPAGTLLLAFSQLAILPKHLLKDEDPKKIHLSEFYQKPVGSGPFEIVERKVGDYTILKPFKDYFKGKPKIDEIVLGNWTDPVLAAEKEELDFSNSMDVSKSLQIKEMDHMEIVTSRIGYLRKMQINLDRSPLGNKKVRQALRYALNIESIVNDFYEGYGAPVHDFMIPGFWTNKYLPKYDYNPEKAKELLKEADWDSDRVLELSYYYDDQLTKDLMAAFQYYWEQVGVKTELRLLVGNQNEVMYTSRDFDLVYGGSSVLDPSFFGNRYHSEAGAMNNTGYYNTDVDKLVDLALEYSDPIIRKALYDQMQKIMHDEFPVMPLFTLDLFILKSKRLKIPEEIKFGNLWYNHKLDIEKWEIEK